MNLCLFFEGTGQGVAGKITNVTRLRDICVDDARQKLSVCSAQRRQRSGCRNAFPGQPQRCRRTLRRQSPCRRSCTCMDRGWCGGSEAVERRSERMDTAYSPRVHEEEPSATASLAPLRPHGVFGILPAILSMVDGMKRMSRGSPSSAKAD